jgi:hypothetical protein
MSDRAYRVNMSETINGRTRRWHEIVRASSAQAARDAARVGRAIVTVVVPLTLSRRS